MRDKAKIITRSKYLAGYEGDQPQIFLYIVNAGRRPIVLRMWAGSSQRTYGKEKWIGTFMNHDKGGQRLAENESYELRLKREDLIGSSPDEDVVFQDIWFEDSLGQRHVVQGAKNNIRKLWASSAG
jgi:hypothetical protein